MFFMNNMAIAGYSSLYLEAKKEVDAINQSLLSQHEVNAINASLQSYVAKAKRSNQQEKHQIAKQPLSQASANLSDQTFIHMLTQASNQTSPANSLWPTIISRFELAQYYDRPEVRRQIAAYLSDRKYLENTLYNSIPYLYYVYQQTQERGMPAEFALLPMLESGYDPFAYSKAGATGIWQMMPGTAASIGLEISWWYDARRDTVVSTQAALNYLGSLNNTFHNWLLSAAAYDAGIGQVQAAEQYNLKLGYDQSFWGLSLPQETQSYVPKLLALAAIIENASEYHVQLPSIPDQPFFSAVNMNSQIDVMEASKLAEVSPEIIRQLNPGMRRWATDPDGTYTLLLPSNKSAVFEYNLAKIAGQEHVTWQYHDVRSGETLTTIAKNYHTTVALLNQVNSLTSDNVSPDQGLLVPLYLHSTYALPLAVKDLSQQPGVTNLANKVERPTSVGVSQISAGEDSLKVFLTRVYASQDVQP